MIHTDMSRKSKDRLRDPMLKVTMRDHATYPSTFLTYMNIEIKHEGLVACTNLRYDSETDVKVL